MAKVSKYYGTSFWVLLFWVLTITPGITSRYHIPYHDPSGNNDLRASDEGTNYSATVIVSQEPGQPSLQDPSSVSKIPIPSQFRLITEYDTRTNSYLLRRYSGNIEIGRPGVMSFREYREFNMKKAMNEYWQQRSRGTAEDTRADFIPGLSIGGEAMDMIFGSDVVNIQPQGSAELIFGINTVKNERPDIQEELRRTTTFDFQEKIQMNVTGTIGERVRLGINYNTEAMFEFENQTKLEYTGSE
ncbi:MAG: hypothetical protein ACLFQA_07245, partial [Bacteroidales bacterium]